jgi:hypothetical protein
LLDIAVMDLGLLPHFFWEMTLVDFYRYLIYKQREKAEEWDRTRVLMSYILNTQVEKKHQKKPRQILPLWIDNIEKAKKVREFKEDEKEKLKKMIP